LLFPTASEECDPCLFEPATSHPQQLPDKHLEL
jgi:hypothetical protein